MSTGNRHHTAGLGVGQRLAELTGSASLQGHRTDQRLVIHAIRRAETRRRAPLSERLPKQPRETS